MLPAEQQAIVSKVFGLPFDQIATAIKDDKEVALTIDPTLTGMKAADIDILKKNQYDSGKAAGEEMPVKAAREKLGLTFEGKTIDNLLAAHKAMVIAEVNKPTDAKVTELEGQLKTVQATVATKDQEILRLSGTLDTTTINSEVLGHLPALNDTGKAVGNAAILAMLSAEGITFKRENGALKPYKNGQLMTDTLGSALAPKVVMDTFITEKKLIAEELPQGRGAGGSPVPVGKALKLSDLKAQYTAAGKSLNGKEFMDEITKLAMDKNFDMNA